MAPLLCMQYLGCCKHLLRSHLTQTLNTPVQDLCPYPGGIRRRVPGHACTRPHDPYHAAGKCARAAERAALAIVLMRCNVWSWCLALAGSSPAAPPFPSEIFFRTGTEIALLGGVSCAPAVEHGPWGRATANGRPCSAERRGQPTPGVTPGTWAAGPGLAQGFHAPLRHCCSAVAI